MSRRSGLGQEAVRRANMSSLLTRVHLQGPTTRAELTTALGLNRSTIGDLTGALEELGLVSELPPGDELVLGAGRRSGRPSLVVAPRPDVAVLAAALDVDRITVALVGLGGVVLDRRVRQHQRGEHDSERVAETVTQMCAELSANTEARILAAGVSVPGAVRERDGLVRFAPNLGWTDEPFAEMLGRDLQMPVLTANDADLGARAEHLRGAAVGADDVGYITGSVGIGGGFFVGGAPLRGSMGFAGEVGHVMVDSAGDRCRCGAIGCLETKVGENQLLAAAGRLPGGGPPAVAEVIGAADAGDPRAGAAVDTAARWLGVGLRPVFSMFNPEMVVLGGLLSQVWNARRHLVLEALDPANLVVATDTVDIRPSALGDDASLLGAAELAFAPILSDPTGIPRPDPDVPDADRVGA